ncbi:MAG: hypothetical protein C0606_16395 [Hyphomicrobiales bacterium]|nr:MAG: hypothetical protein C0606_16395 [Hyphomicrobiales bacterium]
MKIAEPFHAGLKARKLLIPWCEDCGRPHFYPRSACPHCWGETYDWREASGNGVIHCFTVVHNNPPPAFVPLLPYAMAVIELDEGVRLLSNIEGDRDGMAIGDRVTVTFAERDGEILPLFKRQF